HVQLVCRRLGCGVILINVARNPTKYLEVFGSFLLSKTWIIKLLLKSSTNAEQSNQIHKHNIEKHTWDASRFGMRNVLFGFLPRSAGHVIFISGPLEELLVMFGIRRSCNNGESSEFSRLSRSFSTRIKQIPCGKVVSHGI